MPPRRDRPMGQRRRGDPVGRLAHQLTGDPRARLSSRHPRADVLVARGTGLVAAPRSPAPHHAHAVDCARPRRCPHGVRHAGRRQSRSVVPAVLRQRGRSRDGSASGDRRSVLPDEPRAGLLLSASGRALAAARGRSLSCCDPGRSRPSRSSRRLRRRVDARSQLRRATRCRRSDSTRGSFGASSAGIPRWGGDLRETRRRWGC